MRPTVDIGTRPRSPPHTSHRGIPNPHHSVTPTPRPTDIQFPDRTLRADQEHGHATDRTSPETYPDPNPLLNIILEQEDHHDAHIAIDIDTTFDIDLKSIINDPGHAPQTPHDHNESMYTHTQHEQNNCATITDDESSDHPQPRTTTMTQD